MLVQKSNVNWIVVSLSSAQYHGQVLLNNNHSKLGSYKKEWLQIKKTFELADSSENCDTIDKGTVKDVAQPTKLIACFEFSSSFSLATSRKEDVTLALNETYFINNKSKQPTNTVKLQVFFFKKVGF